MEFCSECGRRQEYGVTLCPSCKAENYPLDKYDLNYIDAFKKVVTQKYASFSGRACRREFFGYSLMYCLLISSILLVFGLATLLNTEPALFFKGLWVVLGLFVILLIPSVAVTVRRLHDTNRSGWWIFINLIPVVGWIAFAFFLCARGDTGINKYGIRQGYVPVDAQVSMQLGIAETPSSGETVGWVMIDVVLPIVIAFAVVNYPG